MDAVQINDMLMGGMMNALETLSARRAQRQEIAQFDLEVRLQAWERYAQKLESENDRLRRIAARQIAVTKACEETLVRVNVQSIDYMAALLRRIERLDQRLQRESANEHSMTAVRDLLLKEVQSYGNPQEFTSLDPDVRAKVMEDAWQDFMRNHDVRLGVPERLYSD